MTLQEAFDNWCRELVYLKNRSPKTLRSYRQAWASLKASLDAQRLQSLQSSLPEKASDLTKAELQAWVVGLRERGLSPSSCNVYIRAINSFTGSPELRLKLLKTDSNVIQTYSDNDIKLIISFKPKTFSERRIWTLVLCCLDTGCRIDELLSLTELNLEQLLLTVNGKGNKQRTVPISLELRKHLFRYLKRYGCHDFVFSSRKGTRYSYRNAVRDFKKLKVKLGLPEQYAFHQLRHSFATGFLRNGGSLPALQRILGHSSIVVTQKYLHLLTEDLSREHLKTSPLNRLS